MPFRGPRYNCVVWEWGRGYIFNIIYVHKIMYISFYATMNMNMISFYCCLVGWWIYCWIWNDIGKKGYYMRGELIFEVDDDPSSQKSIHNHLINSHCVRNIKSFMEWSEQFIFTKNIMLRRELVSESERESEREEIFMFNRQQGENWQDKLTLYPSISFTIFTSPV